MPFGVRLDGITEGRSDEGIVMFGGVGSTIGDAVVEGPVDVEAAWSISQQMNGWAHGSS